MISAVEALRMEHAQLNEQEKTVAANIEGMLDEGIKQKFDGKNPLIIGVRFSEEFKPEHFGILHVVLQKFIQADWIPEIQPWQQESNISNVIMNAKNDKTVLHLGFKVILRPTARAYAEAHSKLPTARSCADANSKLER